MSLAVMVFGTQSLWSTSQADLVAHPDPWRPAIQGKDSLTGSECSSWAALPSESEIPWFAFVFHRRVIDCQNLSCPLFAWSFVMGSHVNGTSLFLHKVFKKPWMKRKFVWSIRPWTDRIEQLGQPIGQKLKGSFYRGVVVAKGCEFLLLSLGEGFGVGFRGWWGVAFLWKMREKGEGVGRVGVVGTCKGTASQCARARLPKLPFSNLPFVSPQT